MTKEEIVVDWLERYTGMPLANFGKYILLTNFDLYLQIFAETEQAEIYGRDKPMQAVTSHDGLTMINFGIGSPNIALIMDLLQAIKPKAVLFLGKCGSLKKKLKIGDLLLPIAGIRAEGTSNDYADPLVPSLPSFRLQRAVSSTIIKHERDYFTGTVFTTNKRLWEYDEVFKDKLRATRASVIDMETATMFIVGFKNTIPHGALLLVSDEPMAPDGVKTSKSDKNVTAKYVREHVLIGIDSLKELQKSGESVKHLRFDEASSSSEDRLDEVGE